MAMYLAKKEGYGKVVTFNDQLKQKILRKNEIEILLRKADLNTEFQLYYQPQFNVSDKRLIGMEALLRWNCPEKGFISPSEFIPISEETNSIIPIGAWVLTKAVDQIAAWNRKYDTSLKMGINVSPKQLDQIDFSANIQKLLQNLDVPSEWIDIEITEGVAVDGEQKISKILHQFRQFGISVSIDDFGTGYSSLSYLKSFPIQRVKIAFPLIYAINLDRYDMLIVRSIILLASSIGIHCLAEGVETKMQFDLLHDLGCEQVQGFYLGKPMTPDEFEEVFLKTHRWEEKKTLSR
jgi:EAL domain-containing protein (putative c-di-GMP-specific phosphodiesterase class I)